MILIFLGLLVGLGSVVGSAIFTGMNYSPFAGLWVGMVNFLLPFVVASIIMPRGTTEGSWMKPFMFITMWIVISLLISIFVFFTSYPHSIL